MLSQRIFAILLDLALIGWARDQYVTPLILYALSLNIVSKKFCHFVDLARIGWARDQVR